MVSLAESCASAPRPAGDARRLALKGTEVQLHRACLDVPGPELQALEPTLSEAELERAARFHFQIDRDRFVAGRGILRSLLGHYTGIPPHEVPLANGPNGKPQLAESVPSDVYFNLAHAGSVALYAFTCGSEVGVDLEALDASQVELAVAESFFSRAEVDALWSLPADERAHAFLRCWSRKEAYVKGRGTGLSTPLAAFDVSLERGARNALLRVRGPARDGRRWSVRDVSALVPGHAAAVARETGDWEVRAVASFGAPITSGIATYEEAD